MYDLGVSHTFHFRKKIMEASVIFLRNGVLILNGKENNEATAICFEIKISKKKKYELSRKVPSKIHGSNFIMEKNIKIFWFVNISEYHQQEMGLEFAISHIAINFSIPFVCSYKPNYKNYG